MVLAQLDSHMQKIADRSIPVTMHELKCKWIKDLTLIPVTLNLLEEKVGITLEQIGTGERFLNITPVAQTLRASINKWDLLKLRSFCKAKETVSKTKQPPTE